MGVRMSLEMLSKECQTFLNVINICTLTVFRCEMVTIKGYWRCFKNVRQYLDKFRIIISMYKEMLSIKEVWTL